MYHVNKIKFMIYYQSALVWNTVYVTLSFFPYSIIKACYLKSRLIKKNRHGNLVIIDIKEKH